MDYPVDKKLASVTAALSTGQFVCIFDDTSKHACGYLLLTAQASTKEKINFMINHGRGVILSPMQEEFAKSLGLSPLGDISQDPHPVTIGVEARSGITTGISSADRAASIQAVSNWEQKSKTIIAPGHIFPLIGKKGGLLVKSGIAEASLDVLKIARQKETGALTHILTPEGELASEEELLTLTKKEQIPFIKISEIIQHRLRIEPLITKVATARLPMEEFGEFIAHCYVSHHDQAEHLVLTKNLSQEPKEGTLVRMHSERKFGDLFLKTRDDSRKKLYLALKIIHERGSGALVYIRKHKSNFLSNQLKNLFPDESDNGAHEAEKVTELRELGIGAQMLLDLHIKELLLLTSNPKPIIDLSVFDLHISQQILLQ